MFKAARTLTPRLSAFGRYGFLHDRFAGTAVVYSWDARAARLRWLAKQDAADPA